MKNIPLMMNPNKTMSKHLQSETSSLTLLLQEFRLPSIIAVFGVILSIAGFIASLNNVMESAKKEFFSYSQSQFDALQHRFNSYMRGLEIVQAGFTANEHLNQYAFEIKVAPLFERGKFSAFLFIKETLGGTYSKVYSKKRSGITMPDNLLSKSDLINAIEKSNLTKQVIVSENVLALNQHQDNNQLVFVVPSLKTDHKEYILAVLDLQRVFNEEFSWYKDKNFAEIMLINTSSSTDSVIYHHNADGHHYSQEGNDIQRSENQLRMVPFYFQKDLSKGLNNWQLLVIPTQDFISNTDKKFSWAILLFGLLLTGIMSAFLFSLTSRNIYTKKLVRDKTASLRESQEKMRAIVENTVDGLITINERGVIETYNVACEKIFGFTPEEVIGQNVKILMPEPYHSEHDGYLKGYKKTGDAKIIGIGREVKGKRKDGSTFPIDLSVSEVELGNKKLFSGIVRDITERKQTEKALKQSNEELERFAYVASHDLKAPLRAIDTLSEWLEEDLAEVLQGENKETMDTLRGRVSRMEKLLDDLLEYSRVGRKIDKSFQEVVTGDILMNDIICLISPSDKFSIRHGDNFNAIQVNRMPLQQVLFNLINNAIKHHDKEEGLIEVSIESNDTHHIFKVVDDGPGIPEEYQAKVFEMFQTLRPRDEVEGSGMGLAIVKKIIDNYGGEVELISTLGQGSTFRFTCPKQPNF